MQLPEWTISLIGVAVGAIIPTGYLLLRDYWQNRKHRQEIRKILHSELTLSVMALKLGLAFVEENNIPIEEDELSIDESNPIIDEFPLSTAFYDKLDIQALAKALEEGTLLMVKDTYRAIKNYNKSLFVDRVPNDYSISFTQSLSRALVGQIEETIKILKQ